MRFLKKAFLFLLLNIPFFAIAQNKVQGGLITKIELPSMPRNYYFSPTGKIEGLSAKRMTTGDAFWVVYSDRENNQTYFDKNCTESQKNLKLNFMEALVVAEETEDALRVVRFDPASPPFEQKGGKKFYFKPDANDLGWIKKRNLLLWNTALVDDSTNYTIKAISVKKINDAQDIKEILKKGILSLYTYPEENKEYDAGTDITLFQYLFVLKKDEEKNMVLLSKTNKLVIGQVSEDVLGWAPKRKIHVWDNAICLRVNFDPEAVQERDAKNIKVQFFPNPEAAKNFRDGKPSQPLPFYYSDPSLEGDQKDNPYMYGFPIIEASRKDPGIFKTGYVTNTMTKDGKSVFTVNKQAKYNQIFQEISEQLTKVNIVFVMDGNYRSSFYKTIASCIKGMEYIGGNNRITRNDYKLGAVIYNDSKCEAGPFKVIPLKSGTNKEDFSDELYMEAGKTPCVLDREIDGAPSMYEAISKACNMFDNAKTTNLVIVVGGASSKDKTLRQAALDALIDKQVKLNFFQVQNKNGDNFDQFARDAKYFLQNTAKSFDTKYFKDEIIAGKRKAVELKSGDNFAYLENSGIPGAFSWKDIGESFKPVDINKKIQSLISDNEKKMSMLRAQYEQNTSGADRQVDANEESTKQLMALLKERGLSEDDINSLANQQNFQLFIEGYATLTTSKLKNEILSRTLFMSRREFDRLTETFVKLDESFSSATMREGIYQAYVDIILKYKGGDVDREEIAKWTPDKIYHLVTSLPETNNKLFKKPLKDLKDEKKTSMDELYQLKNAFSAINKKLRQIKSDKKSRIEQEDDYFYWVPESAFKIQN